MAAEYTLGVIASARQWRTEFQSYVRDHVGGVKVRILREPRMAFEEHLDVIVIDDVSPFLNRSKVILLQEHGVRVVGVYDPDAQEGLGQEFLESLGVDLVLPATLEPDEIIRAIDALAPHVDISRQFDEVIAGFDPIGGEAPAAAPTTTTPRGPVVAVGGPPGAGATEVAVALADVLGARGEPTVLIDLDEVAPTVGRRLGFALQPNVLSALEATGNRTRPLHEVAGQRVPNAQGHVGFHVIPGLANVEDWPQLRVHEVMDMLELSSRTWRNTVIDTSSRVEDLVGYGLDRYGASRAVLAEADLVIGVTAPTPVGVLRFLDWAAELRALGREGPIWVVINQAPKRSARAGAATDLRSAFNRTFGSAFMRAELEEAIRDNIDERMIAGITMIPFDERVSTAMWEGRVVSNGPFVKAVASIADAVIPRTGGRTRRATAAAGTRSKQEKPARSKKGAKPTKRTSVKSGWAS